MKSMKTPEIALTQSFSVQTWQKERRKERLKAAGGLEKSVRVTASFAILGLSSSGRREGEKKRESEG